MVHTLNVVESKATEYDPPALLVAINIWGVLAVVIELGWVKVMVCGSLANVTKNSPVLFCSLY